MENGYFLSSKGICKRDHCHCNTIVGRKLCPIHFNITNQKKKLSKLKFWEKHVEEIEPNNENL